MLGFVNDARGKAYIAEAREVYVAAQATATEIIAGNNGTSDITDSDLGTALGSALVAGQTTLPSNPTKAQKASYQMNKYLASAQGGDLTILAAPAASGGAAWTVVVGAGDTAKTGKVNSLIYIINGYQVTIDDGNSTVQKWVASAAPTPPTPPSGD